MVWAQQDEPENNYILSHYPALVNPGLTSLLLTCTAAKTGVASAELILLRALYREHLGIGVECKPGKPVALDAGDLLPHGIGDGNAAISRIPVEVKTDAIHRIAKPGLALFVEFDEWICFIDAIDAQPDHDFLGMIIVRRFGVDCEIGAAGFFIAGVGITLIVAKVACIIG